jgi:hypothetical protein
MDGKVTTGVSVAAALVVGPSMASPMLEDHWLQGSR